MISFRLFKYSLQLTFLILDMCLFGCFLFTVRASTDYLLKKKIKLTSVFSIPPLMLFTNWRQYLSQINRVTVSFNYNKYKKSQPVITSTLSTGIYFVINITIPLFSHH